MSFKEIVIAKYLVIEQEEVTAGWKEILKKAAGFILGGLLFSQSAFGFQFKTENLKNYESAIRKTMHSYTVDKKSNTEQAKYDFKVEHKKSGNVQHVAFKIIKNGKVAGEVNFTGTPKSKNMEFNKWKASLTEDGKDDEWVKYVVDSQVNNIEKMAVGK